MKMKYCILFFVVYFFSLNILRAADEGDVLLHGVASWNQDLKVVQGRYSIGYAFWNDFSLGASYEHNGFFSAPGAGITWHLEPFEIVTHAGPLFWDKNGVKKTYYHISLHANYLTQITSHLQFLLSAGVNLPGKRFRGVPIGAGIRYWF